jgi:hypothetical protein
MSYKYVLKYKKGSDQKISIEAWPRLKQYATEKEKKRPSFVIGAVSGSRTIMLWHYIEQSRRKYNATKNGKYTRVIYPPEDADAVNDAYRTGLAAAAVEAAEDPDCADAALRYIMTATNEEVWFWTSKLLGVVGDRIDRKRVLTAIYIMSGAVNLGMKKDQTLGIYTLP